MDLEEIQDEMGNIFDAHSTSRNKGNIVTLGIEYNAWNTIPPNILKRIWVFDKVKNKYVLLDLSLNMAGVEQKSDLDGKPGDGAMLDGKEVGGIDLNPSTLYLNVEGDEINIDFTNPQILNNISVDGVPLNEIDGFIPVIINVAPITNIPMLLGEAEAGDDKKLGSEHDSKESEAINLSKINHSLVGIN